MFTPQLHLFCHTILALRLDTNIDFSFLQFLLCHFLGDGPPVQFDCTYTIDGKLDV
jgi:hypothetical protein